MRFLVIAALALAGGVAGAQPTRGENMELTPPLATVGFVSGSAQVGQDEREALAAAVSWMKDHPEQLLVIQGYADQVGTQGENMTLSQNRADSVHAALLALGADPKRIVDVAYGEEDRPGRRVEVRGTLTAYPDLVRGQNPYLSPRTPLPPPPRTVPPRRRSGAPAEPNS